MRYRQQEGEALAYISFVILPQNRRLRRDRARRNDEEDENRRGRARQNAAARQENFEDEDFTYFTQAGGTDLDSMVFNNIISSWISMGPFSYMVAYNVQQYRTRGAFTRRVKNFMTERWRAQNDRLVGARARRYRIDPPRIAINVTFGDNFGILRNINRNNSVPIGRGTLLEYRRRLIARNLFENPNDLYLLSSLNNPQNNNRRLKAVDLTRAVSNFIPRPGTPFEECARSFLRDLYYARRMFTSVRFYRVSPYTGRVFKSTRNLDIIIGRNTINSFIARLLPDMLRMVEDEVDEADADLESETFAEMQFGEAPAEHTLGISAFRTIQGSDSYTADIVFKHVAVKTNVVYDSTSKGNCITRCLMYLAKVYQLDSEVRKILSGVKYYVTLKNALQTYFYGDVAFVEGDKLKLKDFSEGAIQGFAVLRVNDHVKVVDSIAPLVYKGALGKSFRSPTKCSDTVIYYDLETRPITSYMRGKALAETAYPVLCSYVINDGEVRSIRSRNFDELLPEFKKKDVITTQRKKYPGNLIRKFTKIKTGIIDKNYIKGWLQRNFYNELSYDNCVDSFVEMLADEKDGGTVYAHNGGRFDHYFVLRAILKYNQRKGGSMVPHYNAKGSQIIKMTWGNWVFKDTYLFIPSSLSAAGKDFNLEERKTQYIEELGMTSTELLLCEKHLDPWEFLTHLRDSYVLTSDGTYKSHYSFYREYCEQDVIALRELFNRFKSAISTVIGKDYGPWEFTFNHQVSTLPSLSFEFFTRTMTYGKSEIPYTDHEGKHQHMDAIEFNGTYINTMSKMFQGLSPQQVSRCAAALIGGVSYASYGYFKHVSCADIKSCYPWVMESQYRAPIGRHKKTIVNMTLVGGLDTFDFKRYGYGFAVAEVWPDPDKTINRLPYRVPGKVMSWIRKEPWGKTLYPLYDIQDFLLRDKGKVRITELYTTKETVKFKHLFGDFVYVLREAKTKQDNLKAAGDENYNASLRSAAKLILNSLSGKFGQGARTYKSYAIKTSGVIDEKEANPFANAQIGCSLLAVARTLLFTYVDMVATPTRDNILKIETDSLTFFADEKIFKRLEAYCKNKFGFLEIEFNANRIFIKAKKFSISFLAEIKDGKFIRLREDDGVQKTKIVAKGVHPNTEQMMALKRGEDVAFNETQFVVNKCGTLGFVPEISIIQAKIVIIKGTGADTPLIGYDYGANKRYVVYNGK